MKGKRVAIGGGGGVGGIVKRKSLWGVWKRFSLVALFVVILFNLVLSHLALSRQEAASNASTKVLDSWFLLGYRNNNNNNNRLRKDPGKSNHDKSFDTKTVPPSHTATLQAPSAANDDAKNDLKQGSFLDKWEQPVQTQNPLEPRPNATASLSTACQPLDDSYVGVLHIAMGDIGGGASTIFFQFVIGQLMYAEQYFLLPLIHFNNVSNIIYDQRVHGNGRQATLEFQGMGNASDIARPRGHWRDHVPGRPYFPQQQQDSNSNSNDNKPTTKTVQLEGTGVWNDYFVPVVPSLVVLPDSSNDKNEQHIRHYFRDANGNVVWNLVSPCASSGHTLSSSFSSSLLPPYVTLTLKHITPGIHGFAPWAPRCWRYHYLPDYVTKPHVPLHEWLRPSRLLGHEAVKRYRIQLQPHLLERARHANPHCSNKNNKCLGLHIRHSDKAAGRRQVPVSEFLPFVKAFVHAGGEYIYLATDSTLVLQEIANEWPPDLCRRITSLGSGSVGAGAPDPQHPGSEPRVVRSDSDQAVFDLAASHHHQTNMEALVEIQALSFCRFMVHGLSALSESALWLNGELQTGSVNLEDPNHIDASLFGTLVQMALRGEDPQYLPKPPASSKWWKVRPIESLSIRPSPSSLSSACSLGYKGVLLISSTGGDRVTIDMAMFTYILNQLLYAEKHNWLPVIHLEPSKENSVLYDRWAHSTSSTSSKDDGLLHFKTWYTIDMDHGDLYPSEPRKSSNSDSDEGQPKVAKSLNGNGLWQSYMHPVPNFSLPEDSSCSQLPVATMNDAQVVALTMKAPWALRVRKYKHVPDHLWQPGSWNKWYAPIRERAHSLIQKYYKFQPHLHERADAVNPIEINDVCVAAHIQTPNDYLPYLQAFAEAGGNCIYIATDSWRVLRYIEKNFPSDITRLIRTQGDHVVRTTKEWPLHMIDNHHRVNSEALVDILAMSKCQFLLHTSTTASEAAIYLNLKLHNNSVNIDDPNRLSVAEFGSMVKEEVHKKQLQSNNERDKLENQQSATGPLVERKLENATIVFRDTSRKCRSNAVVYLAQKQHSSYTGRNSHANFLRSLDLVNKNYLSLNNHLDNLDLFIFHTNDFTKSDLEILESRLGESFSGVIRLVNLTGSPFWQRPSHHAGDDPNTWHVYPLFSEGYRRMIHWFAIDIWDFFAKWNDQEDCSYRYIFRLDEDSYVHSPIQYDIFDFMKSNQYVYGYRLCAYEMQVTRQMRALYRKKNPTFQPQRRWN